MAGGLPNSHIGMAIKIWTGMPGSGKTYAMVEDLYYESTRGRQCYVNFPVNKKLFPGADNIHEWYDQDDFLKIRKGIIYCDEMHIWFDSRMWSNLSPMARYRFALHRHFAIHIRGTTQSIGRVDTVVRELVDYEYRCEMFIQLPESWGMGKWFRYADMPFAAFRVAAIPTYPVEKKYYAPKTGWHFITATGCDLYTTLETDHFMSVMVAKQAQWESRQQRLR